MVDEDPLWCQNPYITMLEEPKDLHLNLDTSCQDSFEKAERFLGAQADPFRLKWFIISLHHAIHLLMLLALKGSAHQGIWEADSKRESLRKKNLVIKEKWGMTFIDIFNKKNKLLTFLDAYELIKDSKRMNHYIHSQHFRANSNHDESMTLLNNELRNEFIHTRPISFSYGESYILDQISPVLDVALFLLRDSGSCYFYAGNEEAIEIIKRMKIQIDSRLAELKTEDDQVGCVCLYDIKPFE